MTISVNIPTQTVSLVISVAEMREMKDDARAHVVDLFRDAVKKIKEDIANMQ